MVNCERLSVCVLLQIGSAVDKVLNAYSVPVVDKVKGSNCSMTSSTLVSSTCMNTTDEHANEQRQLQLNTSTKRYSGIGGVRIKKRMAHPAAAAAKVVRQCNVCSAVTKCALGSS